MSEPDRTGLRGTARVDTRTKDLAKRIQAGEIAVIDHADLDPVAAESLVSAGVAAVVNASPSFTGRYPNLGPLMLVREGIVLLDDVGAEVMVRVADGASIELVGNEVKLDGETVATGVEQTEGDLQAAVEHARRNVGEQLESFAANTLEYLRTEHHLATDAPDLPPTGSTSPTGTRWWSFEVSTIATISPR